MLQIVQREMEAGAEPSAKPHRPAAERARTEKDSADHARSASTSIPSRPRPARRKTGPQRSSDRQAPQRSRPQSVTAPYAPPQTTVIDWLAVFLGLIAVAAWGGLIPFFIWVYNNIF